MTLREQQAVFSVNVATLINEITKTAGHTITGGEWWRSQAQAWIYSLSAGSRLYAVDRASNKIEYPEPVGGMGSARSLHRSRLAFDINIFINGIWQTSYDVYAHYGEFWKLLHYLNRWGGDYGGDIFHFSMTDGKTKW